MRIMLDPGHGGADPGAVSASGLRESNVNLDVAMKLGRLLQAQGHTVRYTRTEDVAVSLAARARMANEWGAELFITVFILAIIYTIHYDGFAASATMYPAGKRQIKPRLYSCGFI